MINDKFLEIEKEINQIINDYNKKVENRMVELIEIIEGRVPSNEEVKRYGLIKILPNNEHQFFWKGNLLFKYDYKMF